MRNQTKPDDMRKASFDRAKEKVLVPKVSKNGPESSTCQLRNNLTSDTLAS